MRGGVVRRAGMIGAVAALMLAVIGPPGAEAQTVRTSQSRARLVRVGTRNARSLSRQAARTKPAQSNERFLLGPEGTLPRTGGRVGATAPVTNSPVTPSGQGSGGGGASTFGFSGITGAEQAAVNAGGDLEPPDQGLCSNGTDVVELVNNAYAVYSSSGGQLLAPISTTSLFGVPPVQPSGAGSFLSDPRCYYDKATSRWFVVELSIPNYFAPHGKATKSYELIAVSDSSDPTGSYTTFAIDSTDQSDSGCPCFGDYPMIGADANGFYLTSNEYSIYKPNFNGVQLYAVSKPGLVAAADGASAPTVVHLSALPSPFPAETVGETYHLSPALTPADGTFDGSNGGTEYFTMSDAFPVSSDLLASYALSDTSSLSSATPTLHLSSSLVTLGQYYQFPETGMAVSQRPPSSSSQTPLLDYIEGQTGSTVPEGVLQADFDAVEETTYADGHLYTELTNASSPTAAVGTTTAEWFVLAPPRGGTSASLLNEGNLGVSGQSLLYPDVVVNGAGAGDVVFTLTGSSYFPSAAFIPFGSNGPSGKVGVAGAGSGPEDGFTCYDYYVGPNYGGCRWGDYSGGVAVGSNVWMATEYVPPASTRDFYTNWGTFVFRAPAG